MQEFKQTAARLTSVRRRAILLRLIAASLPLPQLASADFNSAITDFTISPDSRLIATAGSDGTVKPWSARGELIRTLNAHTQYAMVKFDPKGEILVTSSSEDDRVKLWGRHGGQLASLDGGGNVRGGAWFSPDGNKLISIGSEKVRIWNFDLDDLLRRGGKKLRDYLSHNPYVEEDRKLCDEIDALLGEKRTLSGPSTASALVPGVTMVTGTPLAHEVLAPPMALQSRGAKAEWLETLVPFIRMGRLFSSQFSL